MHWHKLEKIGEKNINDKNKNKETKQKRVKLGNMAPKKNNPVRRGKRII
jgi:hypothetical protein